MSVNFDDFEVFFLILVRISGFMFTAPFFSLRNVPIRVKTGLAIFITFILVFTIPSEPLEYIGVIGFGILVVEEAIIGVVIGFFANIAHYIINFAGKFIDMEIGFSMVNQLDPTTSIQSTITANLYSYLVILLMMVTNLHHYFLKAIVDTFQVIPVGQVNINPMIYQLMVRFMSEYLIIGFRIVLPIFGAILLVNAILGILAKIAPQMNMFVIGMQLKLLVGLFVLTLVIELIPSVADFIFNEMIEMIKSSIEFFK
ncbi:MAG TPA: flagellar biosynthetic protein FliR [Clostridiales bacterium]|nr:flagellar biosynthetic protein FliR [Clostridiales bacterium]